MLRSPGPVQVVCSRCPYKPSQEPALRLGSRRAGAQTPQPNCTSTAVSPARRWLLGGLLPPPAIAEGRAVARSLQLRMPLGSGCRWAGGTLLCGVLQTGHRGFLAALICRDQQLPLKRAGGEYLWKRQTEALVCHSSVQPPPLLAHAFPSCFGTAVAV